MSNLKFLIGLTSTFVDNDAVNLVQGVVNDVVNGVIPNSEVTCVVSTRGIGDDPETDKRLVIMSSFLMNIEQRYGTIIPLIKISAKQVGRVPKKEPTMEEKNTYDKKVIDAIKEKCNRLPEIAVLIGDMIVHGEEWCSTIPSLNLHPDLPLIMGGTEGIYWNVIGEWVRRKKDEAGGMMHLATPKLDAGTTVAYFRIPLKGFVNGVGLESLWRSLPNGDDLEELIKAQTGLKNNPTHPLFKELRKAEAQFETALIRSTLVALSTREIVIREGKVFSKTEKLINGLDLTNEVVGRLAIWSGRERSSNHYCRKESL